MAINIISNDEQKVSDEWVNIAVNCRNIMRLIQETQAKISSVDSEGNPIGLIFNPVFIAQASAKQKTKMQNLLDYLYTIQIPSRFLDKSAE